MYDISMKEIKFNMELVFAMANFPKNDTQYESKLRYAREYRLSWQRVLKPVVITIYKSLL